MRRTSIDCPGSGPRRRTIAVLALAFLATAGLTACSGMGDEQAAMTPSPRSTKPSPIRVAVVGDSNTTGLSGTLENGIAAGQSWVAQLHEPWFVVVGGWARDGASTALMAEQVEPLPDVDVLVLMGGTNDPPVGIGQEETIGNLRRIVDVVHPDAVVLSSVPPVQTVPKRATDLNAALQETAVQAHWRFADPWAALRVPGGTWAPPYLRDGIHTNTAGYALVGQALRDVIRGTADAGGASY